MASFVSRPMILTGDEFKVRPKYTFGPGDIEEMIEEIPLKNMSKRRPLPPPYLHKGMDPYGNSNQFGTCGGMEPPEPEEPQPCCSKSITMSSPPPPPPLPPASPQPPSPQQSEPAADPTDNNNNVSNRRRGIDKCSTIFLFYTTIVQSLLKTIVSAAVMTMDLKKNNTGMDCDNSTSNFSSNSDESDSDCEKPAGSYDAAIMFMVALAIFGVSSVHFCVGLFLFTRKPAVTMTRDALKTPMNCFAVALAIEIFLVVLISLLLNVAMEIMTLIVVVICTELVTLVVVLCYPSTYFAVGNRVRVPTEAEGEEQETSEENSDANPV